MRCDSDNPYEDSNRCAVVVKLRRPDHRARLRRVDRAATLHLPREFAPLEEHVELKEEKPYGGDDPLGLIRPPAPSEERYSQHDDECEERSIPPLSPDKSRRPAGGRAIHVTLSFSVGAV